MRWTRLRERLAVSEIASVAPVAAPLALAVLHREHDLRLDLSPAADRPLTMRTALARVRLPEVGEVIDALAWLGHRAAPASAPLVALDIETAGLPQAPGGIVGMVALCWHDESALRIRQWTLLAPAGERAMLRSVFTQLAACRAWGSLIATFNGSSFDLPFLRSRAARLGLDASVVPQTHVDLLVHSRRIFGDTYTDCRLSTLEAAALGLRRVDDPSGWEVAEILAGAWRAGGGSGAAADLRRAEVHNALDVASLPVLAVQLAASVRSPNSPSIRMRAARHLLKIGRQGEARERLAGLVADAGPTSDGAHFAVEAALCLAHIHRREGAYEEAARLWEWVCRARPGHAAAHEALAKHLEHRKRQPGAALAVATASGAPCGRRIARLRRKLGV